MGNMLRRHFKTSELKTLLNLAIARLSILKHQRQARCSFARTDVVSLLNLGHHEPACLRAERVIKEQNMLDVFVMIEGYCLLLIERLTLIKQTKECPEELKEAIASLLHAAARCGELPELQKMRMVFASRFGKEFVARAVELRNNCGVNPKMIQKLSTRQASLEDRMKVLKEIASQNGIILRIEDPSPEETEGKLYLDLKNSQPKLDPSANFGGNGLRLLSEEKVKAEGFFDPMTERKRYRDATDAAQAAFVSAAYAAVAARAAVELSRSKNHDPDDQNSPGPRPKEVSINDRPVRLQLQTDEKNDLKGMEDISVGLRFEKNYPVRNCYSQSKDEEIHSGRSKSKDFKQVNNVLEANRPIYVASSCATDHIWKGTTVYSNIAEQTKQLHRKLLFNENDDRTGNECGRIALSNNKKTGPFMNEASCSKKSSALGDYGISELIGKEVYLASHKQFSLTSQADRNFETGPWKPKAHSTEGFRKAGAQYLNTDNRPASTRTR